MKRKRSIAIKPKPPTKNYVEEIIGWCLITLLSCIEIRQMENTIFGELLFVVFCLAGILLNIIFKLTSLRRYSDKRSSVRKKSSTISVGVFAFMALGLPALASYINRFPGEIEVQTHRLVDKNIGTYKGKSYWLYFVFSNSKERIQTDEFAYNSLSVNDQVKLQVVKGRLGFLYVQEVMVE